MGAEEPDPKSKAAADSEAPPTEDPPTSPSGHQVVRSSGHHPITPRPWAVGERVRLRKPHPCGSSDWRITGVGADIRLACLGCDRRVVIPREEFNRRVKQAPDGPPGR
jgi:hypothetical protein